MKYVNFVFVVVVIVEEEEFKQKQLFQKFCYKILTQKCSKFCCPLFLSDSSQVSLKMNLRKETAEKKRNELKKYNNKRDKELMAHQKWSHVSIFVCPYLRFFLFRLAISTEMI